jgi:phosphatidylglycerol---prolipoprotein diacylglyceryl transferase
MLILFRDLFAPPRHLILLVIAAWLGLSLAEKRSEQHGISKEMLNNITFYSLLGYVIGGRVLYAAAHFSAFFKSPLSLFALNPDLFDPLGATLTAILVGFIYGQRQGLSLWPAFDSLTPFLAVTAIGLSLSHLAAGTEFGSPTNMPWGIDLWNAMRHPTQIYEFIASLLTFSLLWFKRPDSRPGLYFITFVALTAFARLIIEAFHGDSLLVFGGFRQAQIYAWIVLGLSFILFEYRQEQSKERPNRG